MRTASLVYNSPNYPIPFAIKTSTFYLLFFRTGEAAIKMCHIIFHDVEKKFFEVFPLFISLIYNLLLRLPFSPFFEMRPFYSSTPNQCDQKKYRQVSIKVAQKLFH